MTPTPGVSTVVLRSVSESAAAAIAAGGLPDDVRVAADYPTEFSVGVAASVGNDSALGPFFLHRTVDDVVVGEIGGAFVMPGTVEIGYAIVVSCWGRGYATDAVRGLLDKARINPGIDRVIAHTPMDRPASGRVLDKAGFAYLGETNDEHDGAPIRVHSWEIVLRPPE